MSLSKLEIKRRESRIRMFRRRLGLEMYSIGMFFGRCVLIGRQRKGNVVVRLI